MRGSRRSSPPSRSQAVPPARARGRITGPRVRIGGIVTTRSRLVPCLAALFLAAFASLPLSAAPAYVRWPDLNGNKVVFCAEGDLWTVADTGGMARRLTSHLGNEFYPHWSPDGRTIAFTGDYDGNPDI